MDTDRELLEMAAKAAGLPVEFDEDGMDMSVNGWYPCGRLDDGNVDKWWNPLTDDGDAFRLACRLHIVTRVLGRKVSAVGKTQADEYIDGDVQRAARRAIVRAAAEIGKGT